MNVLQGLARGVLEGGGKTLSSIGATNIAANLERERAAALEAKEMRILEARQRAEEGLFAKRSEQESAMFDKRVEFETQQNELNNARADRRASMGNRVTASEESVRRVNQLKEQYLQESDPQARQKLAADIAFLEGRKPVTDELIEIGQDPLGNKQFDLKGNVINRLQNSGASGGGMPAAIGPGGRPSNGPWMQFQQGGGTQAPAAPQQSSQAPERPLSVNQAYNLGINNKLKQIQQQMADPALSAEAKLALNAEYAKFQQMLRK